MWMLGPPNIAKLQEKHDIAGLVKALDYPKDPAICRSAAKALGQLRDTHALKPLMSKLTHEDEEMRGVAIVALGTIGDPSIIEPIMAALKDEAVSVRKAAIHVLAQVGDGQVVKPIVALFNPEDGELYDTTFKALVQIAPKLEASECQTRIVEPIGTMIMEGTESQRKAAINLLEHIGWQPDQSALGAAYLIAKGQWDRCVELGAPGAEALISVLKDEDTTKRQTAFNALVNMGATAVEPLIAAMKDEHQEVRQAVFWALIKIGPLALQPLIAALDDENEETALIRQSVASVLGQIGSPEAVVPLIGAFRDKDWSVRRDAYRAIVKIGKPAVQPLISALKHPSDDIKWGAAGTLEALGWKPSADEVGATYWIVKNEWHKCVEIGAPSIEPLIERLGHWDESMCKEAVGALVRIGQPCVPRLITTLEDENPRVRKLAAVALGMIGDERAEQPLIALLSEKDKEVSQAASEAISAIQTGEVWRGSS